MGGTSFPQYHVAGKSDFEHGYDPHPRVKERSIRYEGGASVRDICFRGPAHDEISAYLITPKDGPPGPGVLAVHPGPGDRSFFQAEAFFMAESGITSLLVEMPWAEGERWGRTLGEPEHDRREFIGITKDLRRAIDVLAARPEVDSSRLGYLGLSLGALFGGLLAGTDARISHYALLSGVGSFTDVAMFNLPQLQGSELDTYRSTLSSLDPARFISDAAPAHLLFINGTQDPFGPEKLATYTRAGSEPKEVKVFEAGHYLNADARRYAVGWLLRGLTSEDRSNL